MQGSHGPPLFRPISLYYRLTMQTRRSTRISQSIRVTTVAQADILDAPRPAKRLKTVVAIKEIAYSDVLAADSVASSSRQEPKRPRRAKAKAKPEEPKPEDFPARAESLWKVGVHVSAAGGVENAVPNAAKLGLVALPSPLPIYIGKS